MKPDERALRSLVQQWISKAEVDLRTAERLLRDTDRIRESIAFHSQQAGEKYLKALLVWYGIEFPKTHSIGRLLDLVARVSPDISAALDEAQVLTPFGVEIRYPADFPEVLPGQEETAFRLALAIREAVLARIGSFRE
jgi:HEPN domain-containing protein